jgi:hypothetical protein
MTEQKLTIPSRSVFAAVLLEAMQNRRTSSVVDLTNKIVDLKRNHHLDTSNISIRADRDGWISDDLSAFVNRFVLFGLGSKSPVALSDQAMELCRKILSDDWRKRPAEVQQLVHTLGLNWHPSASEESQHAVAVAT